MINRREMNRMLLLAAGTLFAKTGGAAQPKGQSPAAQADDPIHAERLLNEPLAAMQGPEVSMLTLTIDPGGSSQAHRHTGPVFAYILAGTIENQVDPGPAKTYKPGDFFYEPPMHVHRQFKNPSATEPAKILIVQVEEKGKPFTIEE